MVLQNSQLPNPFPIRYLLDLCVFIHLYCLICFLFPKKFLQISFFLLIRSDFFIICYNENVLVLTVQSFVIIPLASDNYRICHICSTCQSHLAPSIQRMPLPYEYVSSLITKTIEGAFRKRDSDENLKGAREGRCGLVLVFKGTWDLKEAEIGNVNGNKVWSVSADVSCFDKTCRIAFIKGNRTSDCHAKWVIDVNFNVTKEDFSFRQLEHCINWTKTVERARDVSGWLVRLSSIFLGFVELYPPPPPVLVASRRRVHRDMTKDWSKRERMK